MFSVAFLWQAPSSDASCPAVCRKIKLKNFIAPKNVGGCGCSTVLSAKDLLCQLHVIAQILLWCCTVLVM
ncbi:hypothetical protein GAC62_24300 [Salmonella enterica]|nr:hypothetical protein [Salmonella enterica]ECA4080706.1 hypothetical protein [Salmonella enterica subsp. enterica serovar Texas]EDX2434834.1 hypothetical protein [Salmonella enterica subsp. enterica serovar Koenigstuhl]EAX8479948.1 hypothetical protein [Salmonella enterica]EAX9076201.1 hypothetical protein [Salmonella enterica]